MRILLIAPTGLTIPPKMYGGIEKVVYDLAAGLAQKGHDVTIAATKGSKAPKNAKLIEACKPGRLWNEILAFKKYFPLVENFDVVCDHSLYKISSKFLYKKDRPVYIPVCHIHQLPKLPSKRPRLVCVSKSHADYIRRIYGYSARCIYNGIPLGEYRPTLRKEAKLDRFVFIGRLTPDKGGLDALRLCKLLDVPLDIIEGKGRFEHPLLTFFRFASSSGLPLSKFVKYTYKGSFPLSYLLKVVEECRPPKWVYRGSVPHIVKNSLLAKAKALLLPLHYEEPFGLVVIEANACGTPAIVYRRGAMAELVKDGVNGFLVEPDDEEGFLKAMRDVESFAPDACRSYVEKRFNVERMVDEYEKLFIDALKDEAW